MEDFIQRYCDECQDHGDTGEWSGATPNTTGAGDFQQWAQSEVSEQTPTKKRHQG